ncbi:DNA replication protein psf1 [Coemansia aciculifera]|uniref:DNA replication complex GINS protein PSF1 n=2 Tax=Coemansia TaxID=4863 RepID=A0A9W8H5H5_9FUNG|nr:DNA replication protein psf1 [Coemansia pectinata]KAJ2865787.1 DNA replication protein psf1 [Coemansia aciculifera]KAJ2875445.1 DNA replication protein psf1 [Coemansia aciculifera]KAJ2881838.1 DNA replication protein psf1 [Coemansia aciculifera]
MLGDEAFRLAKEAKDIAADHIPAYNEEQVRLVTQETRYLWTRIEEMIASLNTAVADQQRGGSSQTYPGSSQPYGLPNQQKQSQSQTANTQQSAAQAEIENTNAQTALYFLTLNRNKRCLLAYHHRRAQFLRSLLWTLHLASSMIPASLSLRLSSEEQSYARDYARLNSTYRDAIENQLCPSDSLNWTADGELPPRDLFIEVRVIKDCGEIVTENGVVNLQAGTQHYLHRSDVEHLVTIGYLEHVNPS